MDKESLEQWDGEKWRKPDEFVDSSRPGLGVIAIWYGPGGPDGENATMVEWDGYDSIEVSEYQYLPGLVDEVITGEEFLKTTAYLDTDDVVDTLRRAGVRKPKNNEELLRWVAGLGVAHIAYWGGTEEYVDELPR